MPTVANINERLVNQTAPLIIARYTPQAAGLFAVMLYLRVATPVASLMTELTWSDVSGAQSQLLTGGQYEDGSYTIRATDIHATTAADIVLTIESSVPSVVRASVVIKDQ